jgi:hypothetical protein
VTHELKNIHLGNAKDILSDQFKKVQFTAYYLDGCSGSSASTIDIIQSIFIDSRFSLEPVDIKRVEIKENSFSKTNEKIENFAIGFTITNAGE